MHAFIFGYVRKFDKLVIVKRRKYKFFLTLKLNEYLKSGDQFDINIYINNLINDLIKRYIEIHWNTYIIPYWFKMNNLKTWAASPCLYVKYLNSLVEFCTIKKFCRMFLFIKQKIWWYSVNELNEEFYFIFLVLKF